jgi:hypothetical protein
MFGRRAFRVLRVRSPRAPPPRCIRPSSVLHPPVLPPSLSFNGIRPLLPPWPLPSVSFPCLPRAMQVSVRIRSKLFPPVVSPTPPLNQAWWPPLPLSSAITPWHVPPSVPPSFPEDVLHFQPYSFHRNRPFDSHHGEGSFEPNRPSKRVPKRKLATEPEPEPDHAEVCRHPRFPLLAWVWGKWCMEHGPRSAAVFCEHLKVPQCTDCSRLVGGPKSMSALKWKKKRPSGTACPFAIFFLLFFFLFARAHARRVVPFSVREQLRSQAEQLRSGQQRVDRMRRRR